MVRLDDERVDRVGQWYWRSIQVGDDFEAFVFLYFSFVVLVKVWADHDGVRLGAAGVGDHDSEGALVRKYCASNTETYLQDVENLPEFKRLVGRVAKSGDPIVATVDAGERAKLSRLRQRYASADKGWRGSTDKITGEGIGIALRSIRNNLFHGGKLYDSADDKELIGYAIPILDAIVQAGARTFLGLDLSRHVDGT